VALTSDKAEVHRSMTTLGLASTSIRDDFLRRFVGNWMDVESSPVDGPDRPVRSALLPSRHEGQECATQPSIDRGRQYRVPTQTCLPGRSKAVGRRAIVFLV
jgi:hypothetical protein